MSEDALYLPNALSALPVRPSFPLEPCLPCGTQPAPTLDPAVLAALLGLPALGQPALQPLPLPPPLPAANQGGVSEVVVECPVNLVGLVIGKGGETIKRLEQESGCAIQLDQKVPEGMPRKVTIRGSPDKVEHGKTLLSQIMNKSPQAGTPAPLLQAQLPLGLSLPAGLTLPPHLQLQMQLAGQLGAHGFPMLPGFPNAQVQFPGSVLPAVTSAALPSSPQPAAASVPTSLPVDPDVQEFCTHFSLDARMTILLNAELHKRPDTWEGDLMALWEIIETARVPAGLLMVKIKEMQAGTFVGKPKPDKEVEALSKKFKIDATATQRLAEVLAKREDKQGDLAKLERHLSVSNKPSALVMMMLGKLRKGEEIGEPDHKPAPGSFKWDKEVKQDMKRGGDTDRKGIERDRRDDRDWDRKRDRDSDRDRGRERSRDRDRDRREDRSRRDDRDRREKRDRSRSRDRDQRDRRRRDKSKSKKRSRSKRKAKSRSKSNAKSRSKSSTSRSASSGSAKEASAACVKEVAIAAPVLLQDGGATPVAVVAAPVLVQDSISPLVAEGAPKTDQMWQSAWNEQYQRNYYFKIGTTEVAWVLPPGAVLAATADPSQSAAIGTM